MSNVLLLILLIASSVSVAVAQDDHNNYDIYAGFSHNRVDVGDSGGLLSEREGFNGFEVAVKGNLSRYLGLKGDYSFHRKTFRETVSPFTFELKSTIHNLLGGVEIKDNSKETRVKPFAHLLAGIGRVQFDDNVFGVSEGETGFAAALGGGIDIRLGDRVDLRLVQVDYSPNRIQDETLHNFRIGIGIVFR